MGVEVEGILTVNTAGGNYRTLFYLSASDARLGQRNVIRSDLTDLVHKLPMHLVTDNYVVEFFTIGKLCLHIMLHTQLRPLLGKMLNNCRPMLAKLNPLWFEIQTRQWWAGPLALFLHYIFLNWLFV